MRIHQRLALLVISLASLSGGAYARAEDPRLPFAPPSLESPTNIDITTASVTKLYPTRDDVVRLPKETKVGGIALIGGRNVVIIGGHLTVPAGGDRGRRALFIKDATGTVHVEGLLIDNQGGGEFNGIAISAPDAVVQIENLRVEGVTGRRSGVHASILSAWGGVRELRVHGLTGSSAYEGVRIPIDMESIGKASLSNVNVTGLGNQADVSEGQLLWLSLNCEPYPITLRNVYVQPREGQTFANALYPGPRQPECAPVVKSDAAGIETARWPGLSVDGEVRVGRPAGGDFVPPGVAGADYVSPGYR